MLALLMTAVVFAAMIASQLATPATHFVLTTEYDYR